MTYSIVYRSETGNTRRLAEGLKAGLSAEDCIYFGEPAPEALAADRIYAGFWTDKGTCDGPFAAFLKTLDQQEVFLFGTAGFGGSPEYFTQILERVKAQLPESVKVVGTYMCQGKMAMSMRKRYEEMEKDPEMKAKAELLIANFDQALTHPDQADLDGLIQAALEK